MKRKEFLRNIAGTALGAGLIGSPWMACSEEVDTEGMSDGFQPVIRGDFKLDGNSVFLNNGTLGLSPIEVTKEVTKTVEYVNATGNYYFDHKELKSSLGELVGVRGQQIVFTHNVTEGVNIISSGFPLKAGDDVILSDQEHVGNAVPWLYHTKKAGAKVVPVTLGKSGDETLSNLKKAVTPRTRVIAIPHIPCTTGQINPIKEIAEFAKENGIITCVDGAHGPGMIDLDLEDMGCDIYISCGHKWMLGPKGVGFIYLSSEANEKIGQHFVGERSFTSWETHQGDANLGDEESQPSRFFYGTQSTALFKGFQKAAEYHIKKDPAITETYIKRLSGMVMSGIQQMKRKPEILTPLNSAERCGMVTFRFKDTNNYDIYKKLRSEKFIVRFVGESHLNAIRVSTHLYNNEKDIDLFLTALERYAPGS